LFKFLTKIFKKSKNKKHSGRLSRKTSIVEVNAFPFVLLPQGKKEDSELKDEYSFSAKEQVLIGRSASCQIQLPDRTISMEHAIIRTEDQGYVIYNLASDVGIMVNNRKVFQQALQDGDIIKLGSNSFQFRCIEKEKRKYPRIRVRRPLKFLIYGKDVKFGFEEKPSSTEDLSLGGVRIRWEKPLPLNTVIEAMIELPDSSFEIWGKVKWNDKIPATANGKNYWSGIQFEHISEEDKFRLNNFLAEHLHPAKSEDV